MKNIFGLIMVLAIFTACENKSAPATQSFINATDSNTLGSLRIATVNTDSILVEYLFVEKIQAEMTETEMKLQKDLERQMSDFQRDYENYLKVGATMTLDEQNRKEAQLTQRQQNLIQLEQQYSNQLMQHRAQKMEEVQSKIFSFVEEYNKENGNFDMVISSSRTSGVLYSRPAMDITAGVIEALNEDYLKTKDAK